MSGSCGAATVAATGPSARVVTVLANSATTSADAIAEYFILMAIVLALPCANRRENSSRGETIHSAEADVEREIKMSDQPFYAPNRKVQPHQPRAGGPLWTVEKNGRQLLIDFSITQHFC
jgi:hypothetical protein